MILGQDDYRESPRAQTFQDPQSCCKTLVFSEHMFLESMPENAHILMYAQTLILVDLILVIFKLFGHNFSGWRSYDQQISENFFFISRPPSIPTRSRQEGIRP